MSNRNRTAGGNWERELVSRYNGVIFSQKEEEDVHLFPTVGTTRNLSTYMDAMKVDITTVDPHELEKFGLLIQAKNTTNAAPYPKLLKQMEPAVKKFKGIPIVYHKQTQRAPGKERFMTRGEYVALYAADFEQIYIEKESLKQALEEIMTYFDSFPEHIQKELNKFLNTRNL